jgi:BirA family biotin operon repressor/biotin-[acetyl-CoA-carboxylase] ligase
MRKVKPPERQSLPKLKRAGRASEILTLLRRAPGAFVSGAEISRTLQISRTAVWKHIGALRATGYGIDALPSQGYRLSNAPDRLVSSEVQHDLTTQFVARDIHHFETINSTNRAALALAEKGAAEGTTVIAEEQTAGRGRLSRVWFSPPRVNLYASVILRPPVPLAQAPQITLVGAVAAVKAIASVYDGPKNAAPWIKWPNDILLGDRKISGALVETSSEGEMLRHVVLGIGINVNLLEKDIPAELAEIATSLAIVCGHSFSRVDLARRLFGEIEACYLRFRQEGFSRLSAEYALASKLWGRSVRVTLPEGSVEGTAEGLEPDGALRLRGSAGETRRIVAGDVQLLR